MSRPPATSSDAAQVNAPFQRRTRLSIEKPAPAAGTSGARSSASATREITIRLSVFDQRHYRRLVAARDETIRRVVGKLKPALQLQSSVDAGCGIGFFSDTLMQCGLSVRGFDARNENIAEARKRFPHIRFDLGDAEDRDIRRLGKFDLTLCCGLLYHLENPLLAIRNLRAITGKCLLLESMCLPEERMEMLLREEPLQEDQSLTTLGCYASESTLVKMLYRAGFAAVYRVVPSPDHEDFRETEERRRRRTMLLASHVAIDVAGFRLVPEPQEGKDPWSKRPELPRGILQRARRFLTKPFREKYLSVAMRARRVFPDMPVPLRLPFGAWWLAQHSALDEKLFDRSFEEIEIRFVQRFLRPGMNVVDGGAHHGLYTLLSAKLVGKTGRVLAVEPSPREAKRLRRHLRVNRLRNVSLAVCALGEETSEAELYLVRGKNDWCNSLRPPAVDEPADRIRVPLRPMDDLLEELQMERVDFLKLDVEGAELSALRGAEKLLTGPHRPIILTELQDLRTLPWNYAACHIVRHLAARGYHWFTLSLEGGLSRVSCVEEKYDANMVAVPAERVQEFAYLLAR